MNPSPEPLIVVSRPCPRRARAIEKLIAGTLGAPDREAVERHLGGCPKCRGYRDWLRLESSTARDLAGRRARKISLEQVRGRLEQQIARMREAEAARALVRLAEWYVVRRENADPRIYARTRPKPRTRSEQALRDTIEQWKAAPWSAAHVLSPAIEQRATGLIGSPEQPSNRAKARALLDLATDIDPRCYRACWLRADLIGEADYNDRERFERDVERLLSSGSTLVRATALSQRATYTSVSEEELGKAVRLYSQAADLDRRQPNDGFNAWLLSLTLDDSSGAIKHYNDLVARMSKLRGGTLCDTWRRRAYNVAIEKAREEGYIRPDVYRRWSRRIGAIINSRLK